MKVVILAGGLPSILGEAYDRIPKPMVTIGERPILWHIMKLFSYHGYDEFIICTGYKSDLIKEYFLNYYVYQSDITVHLQSNQVEVHNRVTEPWKVSIVDTGLEASTAERLRIVADTVEEDFVVAYGDCISDIDVSRLVEQHRTADKKLTVALAHPTGRNTIVPTDGNGEIMSPDAFDKKKTNAWVNACMMVVSPEVMASVTPGERFETVTMQRLTAQQEVNTFLHEGFWLPVETMRDKEQLQSMWDSGNAVWKVWENA